MTSPSLVLIVPCYNEAARLAPDAFRGFVASYPSASLLFVDDGSTDGTAAILGELRAEAPAAIDLLRLPHRGKAEAVRAGILEGLGRRPALVGFWDADLSTPLAAVGDFLALAAKRPELDILLGSRVNLLGRDVRRRAWRHYPGRAFATAVSLTLDLPVYDTQCGAKVFRANESIASVFAEPFRTRWIFDVEVLARYLALPADAGSPPRAARVYELTVPAWRDVPGSRLRFGDGVRSLFELAAIRRRRAAGSDRRPVRP